MGEKSQDLSGLKVCLECNRQFTGIVCACPNDGSMLVEVMQDPLVGTILAGKYEISSVIGRGGMGVVYKARDALMDRLVAIKMLKAQLISDSMSVKRFHQEGRAASRINHPNVITVHEFSISPSGQPFIVMDYLAGISLADVIKEKGYCGAERTVAIISQACKALNHAHRHGVVHRDLKPSNIVLIDYDGQKDFAKVVDFGVAKLITNAGQDMQRLTQAGEVCGSPVYMSPEQCQGEELDARSDIYSMGVVLYETLTGKLPLIGQTMVETMSKHITEAAAPFTKVRPDLFIPDRLEAVVFKALSKNPDERHQSMDELGLDLEWAIPTPGRSQVLRSMPSGNYAPAGGSLEAPKQHSKLPAPKPAVAISLIIICGVLLLKLILGMNSSIKTTVSVPSAPSKNIIEHPKSESARAIISVPQLAAPKLEQPNAVPAKVSTQKPTSPLKTPKGSEPQRTSLTAITPLRRKANSTLAVENAPRQNPYFKVARDNNNNSRQEKRKVSHRKSLDGETASKAKSNPDPFAGFRDMYSFKHNW